MILSAIEIVNFKNIHEASLTFSPKLNCLVGLNGQGKTNVLDTIYTLSFTKSAFSLNDKDNITHGEDLCLIKGAYVSTTRALPEHYQSTTRALLEHYKSITRALQEHSDTSPMDNASCETISYGLRRGTKKQFRRGHKAYTRLIDHIGLIPLVMVSPEDSHLIDEGSDERRRFLDSIIAQLDREYLDKLNRYNALLKQRNALLKALAEQHTHEQEEQGPELLDVYDLQLVPLAEYIYRKRKAMIKDFLPHFQEMYAAIAAGAEEVNLTYVSQLESEPLTDALARTRDRDLILGWTTHGIHKDDLAMTLGDYDLKRVGSQGQQKTYLLAMKLAQAEYLHQTAGQTDNKPILLLDDIFDKLDSERVNRIIRLVLTERFGQIFITDTDRQHLTELLQNTDAAIFNVHMGSVDCLSR